jgi:hypothetical protein
VRKLELKMGPSFRDLLRSGQGIFNNSTTYYFPGGFAKRSDTIGNLTECLSISSRGAVIVSDLLGAGKTFLINEIRRQLREPAGTEPIPVTDPHFEVKVERAWREVRPPYIVIDEVDNKSKIGDLRNTLAAIAGFGIEREIPVVILGDYTLRSGRLNEFLGIAEARLVPMGPLTREFFLTAVTARICSVLKLPAPEDKFASIFDEPFLRLLIPELDVPNATFRPTLQLLYAISMTLPGSQEPVQIGLRLFQEYWNEKGPRGRSGKFPTKLQAPYERLVEFLRGAAASSHSLRECAGMKPLTLRSLAGVLGVEHLGDRELWRTMYCR